MSDDEEGGFGHGIAVGVAISAVLVHVMVIGFGPNYGAMYGDFGSIELPLLTRITISMVWLFAVPVVAIGLIGALVVKRPRATWLYLAVAALFIITAALTIFCPQLPLRQIIPEIRN